MATGMSEEQVYEQAKKRVEAKRAFYVHLTIYIIVNILLILIWAFVADRGFPWFIFPLCGWGIAIVIHFLGVFFSGEKTNRATIEKEADKIRREQM